MAAHMCRKKAAPADSPCGSAPSAGSRTAPRGGRRGRGGRRRGPSQGSPSRLGTETQCHCTGRSNWVLLPKLRYTIKYEVAVLIVGLSYPTETVLSTKITRNRIVLSFKDSPRKPRNGDLCYMIDDTVIIERDLSNSIQEPVT